jgi:tRNA-2-methylthio-N6-dimethylallyladenosine synthase
VNAYRGAMHDGTRADLAALIRVVAAVDGVDRIRFTTSHPVEFTDSLVAAYAEVPELASYLHLPVQSGSDRVLALMKRGHTALEYRQKIRRVRAARPDISISSDFIVGFPGETERDFEQTLQLIEDIGFDQSSASSTPAGRARPRPRCRTTSMRPRSSAGSRCLQHRINQRAAVISAAMVGGSSACWSSGRRRKTRASSRAAPATCAG